MPQSRVAAWAGMLAIGTLLTLAVVGCGEDEPPPEPATPTPTVEAAAPSPTPQTPAAVTAAPTATASPTPTAAPTATPSPSPTATATPTPTIAPTATPTPTPTPSPSPTATPSPTPTPEPTAAALDASDFDRSRLHQAIASNPLESLRLSTEAGLLPMVEGDIAVTLEVVPGDDAARMLMSFGADDQEVSLELIVIGDTQYLRGVDLTGIESPWVATRITASAPALVDAIGSGDLVDDIIPGDDQAPIVAVGVEACGDGRQCFVLTSPEDTSVRLLVDTETYLPVMSRRPAVGEDLDTDVESLIEWNAEVSISAPADARLVSHDEFALTYASFFFSMMGLAQGSPPPTATIVGQETIREVPAETVVTKEIVKEVPVETIVTREVVRELPVEAVVDTQRSALWLALGASLYGEALDDRGDLFHGDPGISPVRFDPTVDIWNWGAGRIELAEATARELFGPDGEFPCGSLDPVVACGADGVAPGDYLLIWSEMLEPVPLDDAAFIRTFWALFQDGDPANDWEALPQFANDVLDGSDTHYWIAAIPGGWELRRTFGPQLQPMPTDGAAMILTNVVVFWVPVSELGDLDALSLGVASFSGPVEDPSGVDGTLDRSPEPQQPLTPLDEVGF
ncbi:MAG: hypothetical protein OXG33_02345 [Chloroflexi bacterium]|nr:hypothetical protein [Chloroflexota bacterium]